MRVNGHYDASRVYRDGQYRRTSRYGDPASAGRSSRPSTSIVTFRQTSQRNAWISGESPPSAPSPKPSSARRIARTPARLLIKACHPAVSTPRDYGGDRREDQSSSNLTEMYSVATETVGAAAMRRAAHFPTDSTRPPRCSTTQVYCIGALSLEREHRRPRFRPQAANVARRLAQHYRTRPIPASAPLPPTKRGRRTHETRNKKLPRTR
jgi:hypothetical protein